MPKRKTKDLLEVFSEFSPVKMSNGQIRMECPFRDNHTDGSGKMSFFVSPEIGAYHCFSCGCKGNAVKLLTTSFGVNYFDAVELVKIPDFTEKKVSEFDLDITWEIKPPEDFLNRGFTRSTLKHFKFGITKGDWIIIPFYLDGVLKGFQKRKNHPDRIVLNSTGFKKSEYLYNLDLSYEYVIVVEGYSDVMRLYQHGYNAVAILGAEVSKWQAEQISKFKRVYLAFDNDDAGRNATEICYHQIKNNTDVKLIPYNTKDPGECLSKKLWAKHFSEATDYAEYTVSMSMYLEGYLEMKNKVLYHLKHRR